MAQGILHSAILPYPQERLLSPDWSRTGGSIQSVSKWSGQDGSVRVWTNRPPMESVPLKRACWKSDRSAAASVRGENRHGVPSLIVRRDRISSVRRRPPQLPELTRTLAQASHHPLELSLPIVDQNPVLAHHMAICNDDLPFRRPEDACRIVGTVPVFGHLDDHRRNVVQMPNVTRSPSRSPVLQNPHISTVADGEIVRKRRPGFTGCCDHRESAWNGRNEIPWGLSHCRSIWIGWCVVVPAMSRLRASRPV